MSTYGQNLPVPLPDDWITALSMALDELGRREGTAIPAPPRPFWIKGTGPSVADEVRERWAATATWMRQHGFERHLEWCLNRPPVYDFVYDVAEDFAAAEPAPKGMINFHSRPRPHPLLVEGANLFLSSDWFRIVGIGFAAITRPRHLTGVKKRRLIIAADPEYPPPWGDWKVDAYGGTRHQSTRRLVNRALWPMMVSVLDFAPSRWSASMRGELPIVGADGLTYWERYETNLTKPKARPYAPWREVSRWHRRRQSTR